MGGDWGDFYFIDRELDFFIHQAFFPAKNKKTPQRHRGEKHFFAEEGRGRARAGVLPWLEREKDEYGKKAGCILVVPSFSSRLARRVSPSRALPMRDENTRPLLLLLETAPLG